jgi:hypothetical protein
MLRKVVGEVANTSSPVHEEPVLMDAATYPLKVHVNLCGAPLFDSFIRNSNGAHIFCVDLCGTLWVSHLDQSGTPSRGLKNSAANSTSVAEARTLYLMLIMM